MKRGHRMECIMGIGLGIVLLLLGLIFALGVINLPASIDEAIATSTLGWIFVVVGILAIVLSLAMNAQRSRSTRVVEDRRVDPTV
jgi:fumarate reductase subunit D